MPRLLKKGQDWRIGWHPEAAKYQALIGNESWAIELTATEFKELYRLMVQISETMEQIATELMDSERIAIAAESDLLWIEAEGFPDNYSLRIILHQERRCEVNWDEKIAPEILLTIRRIIEENRE